MPPATWKGPTQLSAATSAPMPGLGAQSFWNLTDSPGPALSPLAATAEREGRAEFSSVLPPTM